MPRKRADQGDDRNRTGGPDQQDGKAEFAQPKEGETGKMRRLLMVHRQGSGERESEPIVVDTDDPRVVVFELDDGVRLELDRRELRSSIESQPRGVGTTDSREVRIRHLPLSTRRGRDMPDGDR
jgi:hypothetical protein